MSCTAVGSDGSLPSSLLKSPDGLRQLMLNRPPPPKAPSDFKPWPYASWQTDVLRRAEFIVEDTEVGPTFGNNPNVQSASRPGAVPAKAAAFCEVAAGLLFTGRDGRRLLMAVDWSPMMLLLSENTAVIDDYLASCETVDLDVYLRGRTEDI